LRDRTFGFVLLLFVAIGIGIAFPLSALNKLETYKLLNVVGIVYGLLGVVVLSEFVTQNERWRLVVVNVVSGLAIWSHAALPFGTISASGIMYLMEPTKFPSSLIVAKSFASFFVYAMLPTSLVDFFVFAPTFNRFKDPLIRTRVFGLSLVLIGMLVQLIAAVQDLLES
jgi:hypothetical protein